MSSITIILLSLTTFQVNPLAGQADNLVAESEPGGYILGQIFQNGISADLMVSLGDAFVDISKPLQSEACYQKALAMQPTLEAASKGLEKSQKRFAFLKERIATFDREIAAENKNTTYNQKAAVLFHLGKQDEAISVLNKGLEVHQGDPEINGLKYTFEQGLNIQSLAIGLLEQQFTDALGSKNKEIALQKFGQMIFSSLGQVETGPTLKRLVESFPDLDEKMITDLLTHLKGQKHGKG